MKKFNHINFGNQENEIIALFNSYSGFKHKFSDVGKFKGRIEAVNWHFLKLSDLDKLKDLELDNTPIFFSFFLEEKDLNLESFLIKFNKKIIDSNSKIIKADTVKSPFGYSAFIIGVPEISSVDQNFYYGSIDTYIENTHFRKNKDSKEYCYLASISDVRVYSKKIEKTFSFNFNDDNLFDSLNVEEVNDKNDTTELIVRTNLSFGLANSKNDFKPSLGSKIYLLGFAGYSSYLNYDFNLEYIRNNVFKVRDELLANKNVSYVGADISDGLIKSVENVLRYEDKLKFSLDEKAILNHCREMNLNISLDDVFYGGDDYSLIVFSDSDIDYENCVCIGVVRLG